MRRFRLSLDSPPAARSASVLTAVLTEPAPKAVLEHPRARLVTVRLAVVAGVMAGEDVERMRRHTGACTGSTLRRAASEQNERRRACGVTLPRPAAAATAR